MSISNIILKLLGLNFTFFEYTLMLLEENILQNRITISDLYKKKQNSKIVMLTCYTAPFAKILDNHVDIILVGDSLGMTVYGHNNTLAVTKRMMIDHGKCVVDNSKNALVV